MNSPLKSHVPPFTFRRWSFAIPLLAIFLFSSSAPALVMRENGPEPIIVQIKESFRLSDELDNRLNQLASTHNQDGLHVVKRWAGSKFLILLSFPSNFTRQQAIGAMRRLEQSPAVEKVIPVSAFNLHFRSGDFKRGYGPNQAIPDPARRGLDAERIGRPPPAVPDQAALDSKPHAPNRLIVRWKEENIWRSVATGFNQVMENFHNSEGCRVVREFRYSPAKLTQVLEFDDPSRLRQKLRRYIESGLVVYAQPDFIYETNTTPNDPWYASFPGPQWSLPIISAPQAWGMTEGDPSHIIAVGDSGANVLHSDFMDNMIFTNALHHNFLNNSANVDDDLMPSPGCPTCPINHGSAVASIIGARGNDYAMTGIARNTSLMILKIVNSSNSVFTSDITAAINYAADHGATAINLSVGSFTTSCTPDPVHPGYSVCKEGLFDDNLFQAMQHARASDMVVVCAAGNSGGGIWPIFGAPTPMDDNDLDINRRSPASVQTDNTISVMATNQSDIRASYSSYGKYRVDLAAPGGTAGSPIPGLKQTFHVPFIVDDCNTIFGTSAAAPHVTGALALIKSLYPWENYLGIRDRVLMGVDRKSNLQTQCRTSGRLNIFKALRPRSMLSNLSTRARVGDGDTVMIAGFIIGGSASGGPIEVVMRGRGPSVGVNPSLGDPVIELHYPEKYTETNNNWESDERMADLMATGLQPTNSNEAAMIRWLEPGAYTVILRDAGSAYGVGIIELFAVGNGEESRFLNISTRCLVGTGDNVAIAGTIIGNPGPDSPFPRPDRRVLIFGKGPSLASFGGDSPTIYLTNPQIQVADPGGESNNDWKTIDDDSGNGKGLEEELEEKGFAPSSVAESALWPTFSSGAHTVILSGVSEATGVGLIEFYEY